MKTQIKLTMITSAVFLITACGGGGSDIASTNKYVGTYSYCEDDVEYILQVTDIDGKSLNINPKEHYFQEAGCKGEVMAIYSEPLQTKLEYFSTERGVVNATKNAFPFQYDYSLIGTPFIKTEKLNGVFEVDRFTLKLPEMNASFGGPGVINGCFKTNCYSINDLRISSNQSTNGALGLLLNGDNLFLLRLNNGTWVGSGSYMKK